MEVQLRVQDMKRSVEFYQGSLGIAAGPAGANESHFEAVWGNRRLPRKICFSCAIPRMPVILETFVRSVFVSRTSMHR